MHALTQDEIRRLLAAAKAVRERDWLMILVAYLHGLRASELVGLQGSNVRDGYLTVQRLKGSLKTTHPLLANPDSLLDERATMIEFARKSIPAKPIFRLTRQQFHRIVRAHAKAAKIPAHKAHPHILKHSIAVHLIPLIGVEKVQQWLGHRSLSSTGAYLRVTDEEASAAVAEAFGVGRPHQRRLISFD